MALISIFVLGVLIFVHELGHFLVAKYYNVGVIEFAIGFGPKIFTKQIGETKYSLRAIPLGGYVRMVGDTPDQLISTEEPDTTEMDENEKRLLADKSRWFLKQRVFPRAAIVFAGPLFNILFAYLLAVGSLAVYGTPKSLPAPIVGEVVPDFPAEKAGIKPGDKVLEINGEAVTEWMQVRDFVEKAGTGDVVFKISRTKEDGQQEIQTILLKSKETGAELDYLTGTGEGKKGFMVGLRQSWVRVPTSVVKALQLGGIHVAGSAYINVKSIFGLIKGIISPDSLGGPIAIFREAGRSAKRGIEDLLDFMVFLSVSLAVLNLLPVPVLDGGHLTMFLIEAVRGKPLTLRIQEYATRVGMALLLFLMIYALRNDLKNIFMS